VTEFLRRFFRWPRWLSLFIDAWAVFGLGWTLVALISGGEIELPFRLAASGAVLAAMLRIIRDRLSTPKKEATDA